MIRSGIVVVDKPRGLTSAEVVDEVRRRVGDRRAGHTGTLDPLATGVLPICVGDARRLVEWLIAGDKGYEAELELGVTTTTLDADGEIVAEHRAAALAITAGDVEAALAPLRGRITQVPPMFSAKRLPGRRRMYELARAGEVVERAPIEVVIDRLELLALAPPRARLAIACSKGTYVRTLVDDVGRALGCGAHLTGLRRTRSGAFTLDQAIPLDAVGPDAPRVSLADALGFPRIALPRELYPALVTAQGPKIAPILPEDVRSALVDDGGELLAIVRRTGPKVAFERVFLKA